MPKINEHVIFARFFKLYTRIFLQDIVLQERGESRKGTTSVWRGTTKMEIAGHPPAPVLHFFMSVKFGNR